MKTYELRAARTYRVLVLISVVDRRILPALRFVARLPFADARALHISDDPEQTRRVALDWMGLGLTWLPLDIREVSTEGVPASIRGAVEEASGGRDPVTVVLPELNVSRWWQLLLHRHRARRIAAELQGIPGVTTVIVPFAAYPPPPRPAPVVSPRRAAG